jgi:hypothetical protein
MRDVVRAFPFHGLAVVLSVTLGAACAVSGEDGSGGVIPTTHLGADAGHADAGGSIDGNAPPPGTGTPDPGTGTPDPGTGTPDTGTGTPPPDPGAVDSGSATPPPAPGAVDSGSGSSVDATVPGSGGVTPTCAAAGTSCIDATGAGDFGCFAPGPAFPKGAKTCLSTTSCPTGYSCWSASAGALSGSCIQDCTTSTSPGPSTDAGTTSGTDAGKDSGTTSGTDAGKDSGTTGGTDAGSTTCGSATVSFASTVYPPLKSGCAGCHSQYSTAAKAYTTLTSSGGMGSTCGKLVVAGNTSSSKIIGAVQGTGCTDMSYLSSAGITALTTWICQGAKNN